LVSECGRELLGPHDPPAGFPLLLKYLDARQTLSVQVHPDDARAARLVPPGRGKTEAWVVLDAAPGSVIYAGLKRGFDRPALAREVGRGTCQLCLHSFEPRPGDCIFLPAGTVHALGAGLLIAEIQQASDTTYRLFDWNRLGTDGLPRPLHVEQALDAINYELGPVSPQKPVLVGPPGLERLVECPFFVLDRWRATSLQRLGGDDRCHTLAVVEGRFAWTTSQGQVRRLARGQTLLVPAASDGIELLPQPAAVVLDIYLH
jgi:mannose-6-phosphate isomerase